MLKEHKRWDEIKKFLYKYFKNVNYGKIVACHNDIHAGNVYFLKNNIIFLDIEDISKESYFHDLGTIFVNFADFNCNTLGLEDAAIELLKGYNKEINEENIRNIVLFGLRRLYFVEAYFLYIDLMLNNKNIEFIKNLRENQNKLKAFLYTYNSI
jgi:aminoglycoside phosphotransferase family enzyme